jgi:hypothetical protein
MKKLKPHEDEKLNLLRLLAMGMAGVYLYQAYKKEGNLLGATGKIKSIDIDTDKIVDSVTPWIDIPESQKEIVSDGLKEFVNTVKKELKKR